MSLLRPVIYLQQFFPHSSSSTSSFPTSSSSCSSYSPTAPIEGVIYYIIAEGYSVGEMVQPVHVQVVQVQVQVQEE